MLVQNPEKDEQMTHTCIFVQNYMKRWDPGPRRSTNWSDPGTPAPVSSFSVPRYSSRIPVYRCRSGPKCTSIHPSTGTGLVQEERVLRAALDTHRLYITSSGGASVNYIAVFCLRTEQLTSFWLKELDSHRLHIITSGGSYNCSVLHHWL